GGCACERRGWEWPFVHRLGNLDRLTLGTAAASANTVVFSPDGRWIASGSSKPHRGDDQGVPNLGAEVELWDRETGRKTRAFRGTKALINSVAFSPDGTRIAVGSGNYAEPRESQVTVWDA